MALDGKDLNLVLALVRGRSLPEAAQRLGMDPSSVYRGLKRIEKGLGRTLFERSAQGMAPGELALQLAERAAAIEVELQAAAELLQAEGAALTGTLRIATNELLLHGLLLPLLPAFQALHPQLEIELLSGAGLVRLDRREADVALRGTDQPPEHLVGARLGRLHVALWAHPGYLARLPEGTPIEAMQWATPDADPELADYPSKRWRRTRWPGLQPRLRCDSLLATLGAVAQGAAVAVAPYLLAAPEWVNLSGRVDEAGSDCWLLTHPDLRARRRVQALFAFLREQAPARLAAGS